MARVDAYAIPKSGRTRNTPTKARPVVKYPNDVGPSQRGASRARANRRMLEASPIAE
jgi:hypothetical protein